MTGPDRLPRTLAVIQQGIDQGFHIGAQLYVWLRGNIVADVGLGEARRGIPMRTDTLMPWLSSGKPITAVAIAQLWQRGLLDLDDPVARHIPEFRLANADADAITIRHLLTHTAGLAREAAFPYWTDGAFPGLDEIRAALREQECVLPTDARWKYSNLALVVAGEIVSAVSGRPWTEYVRTHVLEPLGMRDSLVETPAADDARVARPYARRLPSGERAPAPASDVRGISAAAGLTTTVEDLARFAMLQFRGGPAGGAQVLRGSTLREMQRVHWIQPDWQAGWGLGFHISRLNNRTLVGHGGALRGYRSELRFSPAERMAVIVLINADDGEPRAIVDKAFEWVAPALVAATPPAVVDPGWSRYVGRYRNGWGDTQVVVVDGRLMMIGANLPDPMLAPATLVPEGEHTFRIDAKDGYGTHGELAVFELDAAGKVARVKVGANYVLPVETW